MNKTEKFIYIVDSYVNGQRSQAKALFKKLSKSDRKECYKFVKIEYGGNEVANFLFDLL